MYQYAPLKESKGEIRLLELYPGGLGEDIECSIRHATLASTLEYTALSYTWGDPKIRKAIVVDGQTLEVTVNLFDALRYLRSSRKTQTLWVDAVCINQGDMNERSKQVLRMRDIYTFAKTVKVWLGPADDDDRAAMALVKSLGAAVSDPEEALAQGFNEYGQEFMEIFERVDPEIVRALGQLFKRPWWTRVWVVQELSLAKQQAAIVRCGDAAAPWLSFLIAAYAIESCWFIVDAIVSGVFPDDKVDAFNNGIRMAQCRRVDPTVPGICINDRYVGGNAFAASPIAHFQRYAASGVSVPHVSFWGMQMSTAAICFGQIASIGCVDEGMTFDDVESFGRADETGKSASDSDTFNEWLNMILDSPIWDTIAERYGKEDVIDAFCRTLVGNRNNRMVKPPEQAETDPESQRDDLDDETTSEDTVEPGQGEDDMSVSSDGSVLFSPHEMLDMSIDGFRSSIQVAWGKRFAIFDGGHIGIVPEQARVGDIVAVLLGCTMPLVLRRKQSSACSVIGESYVHGAMDGEVFQESRKEVLLLE